MNGHNDKINEFHLAGKNSNGERIIFNPSKEEIQKAIDEYLSKGGTITRVEPEWIEEGRIYIFR